MRRPSHCWRFVASALLLGLVASQLQAAPPVATAVKSNQVKPKAKLSAEAPPKTGTQPKEDAPAGKQEGTVKKLEPTRFIRLRRDKQDEAIGLDTAIVRYVPESGKGELILDLIAVVHVADREYYRKLNKRFEQYDAMLYELVAPKGTRVPKGGRRGGDMLPVAMMKNFLKLDSQMEFVDYSKKNFVHADMSPAEMGKAMKDRGEDGFTLAMGVLRDMIQQSNRMAARQAKGELKLPEITLADLLFNPIKMKRFMAAQLGDPESTEALGQTLNTLLVEDRNKACLKVFQKELANGKKKIAIFYGAAHMPDFEKRLIADYGLKKKSVEWLVAWDME